MLNDLSMEQGPSLNASFLTELELSDGASLLRPTDRLPLKDMVLGACGSALVHMLVVIAALLMTLILPPPVLHDPFVTVSLVEMGGSKGGSCDTGMAGGAEGGPEIDAPPPSAERLQERAPLSDPPETVKPVERVSSSKEKPVKKGSAPPPSKPVQSAVAPAGPSEDLTSVAAPSSRESGLEIAGTGGGEGQGAKGSGEGPGFASAGGSSSGSGEHAGEYNADAVDQVPQALQKVEPVYPPRARKQGIFGRVVLRFLVESDGHVSRPSILEAKPEGYFEQNALEAVRRWRFKPGYYRGKAVATWVTLPVQFRLTE
jgi:periplasmic protein TonB